MTTPLWGLAVGAGMGLVISSLGAGGSLFIVPILIYVFGEPIRTATGTALAVVAAGAAVGAVGHARRGAVSGRVALSFGPATMAGAFAGAALQPRVPEAVLYGGLAVVLVAASLRMLFGQPPVAVAEEVPRAAARVLPLGAAVGLVTGILGVGGGFVIVPALVWGLRLPLRDAIGTSLVVIAAAAATGALTHVVRGTVDLALAGSVGAGAVLGAIAGAPISGRLPERPLRVAFGMLCGLVAAYVLWERAHGG